MNNYKILKELGSVIVKSNMKYITGKNYEDLDASSQEFNDIVREEISASDVLKNCYYTPKYLINVVVKATKLERNDETIGNGLLNYEFLEKAMLAVKEEKGLSEDDIRKTAAPITQYASTAFLQVLKDMYQGYKPYEVRTQTDQNTTEIGHGITHQNASPNYQKDTLSFHLKKSSVGSFTQKILEEFPGCRNHSLGI